MLYRTAILAFAYMTGAMCAQSDDDFFESATADSPVNGPPLAKITQKVYLDMEI